MPGSGEEGIILSVVTAGCRNRTNPLSASTCAPTPGGPTTCTRSCPSALRRRRSPPRPPHERGWKLERNVARSLALGRARDSSASRANPSAQPNRYCRRAPEPHVRRIDGATPSASAATTRHDAMDREGVVASPPRRGPPRRARENDIESRRVVTHSNCLFKAPQSARRVESPPRGTIACAVVSNARGSWRTFTSDTTWCVRHRTSREPARDGAPARAIDPSTRVVSLRLARLVFSSRALNKSRSNRIDRSVADDVPPSVSASSRLVVVGAQGEVRARVPRVRVPTGRQAAVREQLQLQERQAHP
eukprot:30306-Pelagococcus_subviridis.AAC.11